MGPDLQQAHNEQVHPALQSPLLRGLPLPAVLDARQLRRHGARWLLPHAAHIRAERGIRDGCNDQITVTKEALGAPPMHVWDVL